ncbi:hypothetical protein GCM10028808_50050 [Spirosoma migulaei]
MDVTANIKAIRVAKGVSQAELSRRLELDTSSYHRIENRGNKLSIEQVEKIATALDVSFMELLTWGEEKGYDTPINDLPKKLQERINGKEKELEEQIKQKDYLINLQRDKITDYEQILASEAFTNILMYALENNYNINREVVDVVTSDYSAMLATWIDPDDLMKMYKEGLIEDNIVYNVIKNRIIRNDALLNYTKSLAKIDLNQALNPNQSSSPSDFQSGESK